MHVDSRMHVVEHVPPNVVGVFVHHKVIPAVPAPVRAGRPIPIRHLEVESAGKPESVMVAVNPLYVVAVRRAETLKAPVLEWMILMEAFVIRMVMPIPMIVADVLRLVDFPVWMTLRFRFPLRGLPMRGWRGNASLISSRHIVAGLRMLWFRALPSGVSTFRMLRVYTRGPEQNPCAQQ